MGDLSPKFLNGVPTSSFLLKNISSPLTFTGTKTFAQSVSITDTFELTGTLNGHNITELWEQGLKMDGNQTLSARLLIGGDLEVIR